MGNFKKKSVKHVGQTYPQVVKIQILDGYAVLLCPLNLEKIFKHLKFQSIINRNKKSKIEFHV